MLFGGGRATGVQWRLKLVTISFFFQECCRTNYKEMNGTLNSKRDKLIPQLTPDRPIIVESRKYACICL